MNYKARIDEYVQFRWAKGEELDPKIEKMFWNNLGKTPMCCVDGYAIIDKGEVKEYFNRCDMLEKALPKKLFEKFCLECQMKIAVILFRRQTEGKNVKDYTKDDKRKLNKTVRLITRLAGNMC